MSCCFKSTVGANFYSYNPTHFDALTKSTHCTFAYANAFVCVGQSFEVNVCRKCKRQSFKELVAASRSFVAELKAPRARNDFDDVEVSLLCSQLFFTLFRRARNVLSLKPESDYLSDVDWTLERGHYLGQAIMNIAAVTVSTELARQEVKRALKDLAHLATDISEWQMELTDQRPPVWMEASSAFRANRLAVFFYDAIEQIDIASRRLAS